MDAHRFVPAAETFDLAPAPNGYDVLRLDVEELLARLDAGHAAFDPRRHSGQGLLPGAPGSRLRLLAAQAAVASGVHRRLVQANLRLDWFDEFNAYWTHALGNRPLQPHDFYHLHGVFRQAFQRVALPEDASGADHLATWRQDAVVYQLFSFAYKQALRPLPVHRFRRYVRRGASVCEYGAGLAPIATSLGRYYRHRNLRITCADLPHLLFHFVGWRFRDAPFVRLVPIAPDDDAPLPDRYDVVFCMTVFEHLPRPLAIARHLHERLHPGGYLIFDYLRSEATGLDTRAGLDERMHVLRFIAEHFDVVEGDLRLDGGDVDAVVCRKR